MTSTDESGLESEIRTALYERARAIQPSMSRRPTEGGSDRGRRVPRRIVPAFMATAAVVAIVVAALLALGPGNDDRRNQIRTTSPPLTGFGSELPLTVASPPAATVARLVSDTRGAVTDSRAVAVSVPDGTVITKWTAQVNGSLHRCVAGGNSRGCGDVQAPPPGVTAPENITELGDDTTTQLLWLDLPPGTAYTAFTREGSSWWQRPVEDMSVFSLPAVNGTPVHLRALDINGRELHAFDYTSTNGEYIANWPPWWDLPATLRWCDEAPLIDVERMINGGQGDRFRAMFPGAGIIDIDVREACRQLAPLRPTTFGHILAEWTLRNGRLAADYYEHPDLTNSIKGAAIPEAEALQRMAVQRAQFRRYCTTHPKPTSAHPECARGGPG